MKKILSLIIMSGLSIVPAFAQDSSSDKAASDPPVQQSQLLPIEHPSVDKNWEVIFKDDFNTFDTKRWYKVNNGVHGEGEEEEPQVYDSSNVSIKNGELVLRTERLYAPYQWTNPSQQCPRGSNCEYGGKHYYTSGKISSNKRYKYGYYEIYAKLPASDGYWPAFWFWYSGRYGTSDSCWYNEIDIAEINGCDADSISCSPLWHFAECDVLTNQDGRRSQHFCNYTEDYHWYGLEWNSSKITWYLDRKAIKELDNNMEGIGIQNPLRIIINVALQPASGKCPISVNTTFPNEMHVEQANAYRLKFDCKTEVNEIPDFDTFNYAVKKSITLSGASSIAPGEKIVLRATDFIELKAGFEVPLGAELYLGANPCSETVIE